MKSLLLVTVVDPHAPGGVKHFDRLGVKRKFEEMQRVCLLPESLIIMLHVATGIPSRKVSKLSHFLHTCAAGGGLGTLGTGECQVPVAPLPAADQAAQGHADKTHRAGPQQVS